MAVAMEVLGLVKNTSVSVALGKIVSSDWRCEVSSQHGGDELLLYLWSGGLVEALVDQLHGCEMCVGSR